MWFSSSEPGRPESRLRTQVRTELLHLKFTVEPLNNVRIGGNCVRYSTKVMPYVTAAAIAMIVVTNYCILQIVGEAEGTSLRIFYAIWPVILASTTAIILVMSTLYRALQTVVRELERSEHNAREFALLDPLTGLGNRTLVQDRLAHAISELRRNCTRFAVHMVDLDRFKDVNDSLGHAVGDELLREVGDRLRQLVRNTDTVARVGGDEFIVLQTQISSAADVRRLSDRLERVLREPVRVGSHELAIAGSIGAVIARDPNHEPAEYLRRADIALYHAKNGGRNRAASYSPELDEQVQRRARIEWHLREVLTSDERVHVHFQPQVRANGDISGAEVLLRWIHPEFGALSAQEVITVAEQARLITELGTRVFREACEAARQWPSLSIAVNFSPLQLIRSKDLPDDLTRICQEYGVPPRQIELEVTESLFVNYDKGCEAIIAALRQRGFRIALDDFGAGYSSLSYLRRFQVDKVKLDKGFSCRESTKESMAIIRAAVMLAHALNLEVIAEGIETEAQEQVARQGGCDGFQGFRFGPAMSCVDFSRYMNRKSRAQKAA